MTVAAFLFGKLPAHGDFVARALGDGERAAWDARGSTLLGELRARTGDDFDHAHVAVPPWRFLTLGGDGWTAGAVAPSVDAVGRRFLLALGAKGLSAHVAGAAGLAFAEAAEALIYNALAEGLDADALVGRAADRFGDLLATNGQAARALAATPGGNGLWWTLGSETFPACALADPAPPADLFARTVAAGVLERA